MEFLVNKNIAILGFWKEGESSLVLLLKIWIKKISILDQNSLPKAKIDDFFKKNKLKKDDINLNLISWETYLDNLSDYDYIFKSPGISPYNPKIDQYRDKLISQTSLFYKLYKWKIISITATKWKSTISSLIFNLLKNSWLKTKLVWNIWTPVFDEIKFEIINNKIQFEDLDYIVFELSSYMLEDFENNSYISILSNIFPDHLDWHKNFDNYKKAKENILKNSDFLLIWLSLYQKLKEKLLNRNILSFGSLWAYYSYHKNHFYINWLKLDQEISTKLKWNHNLDNLTCILAVSDILKIDEDILFKTIKSFKWLNHRLENIWKYRDITFIDDAISTTPESTVAAIETYKENIWTIFLGWSDRWYKFDELIKILKKYKIFNLVLFPNSWIKIKNLLDNNFNILETKSMKEAVEFWYKNTPKWKICLLSCASPSYSLWKNYKEKWNDFKKNIIKLVGD